jgi:hypothetical protein
VPPPAPERSLVNRLRLGVFLPVLQELDEAVAAPADLDLGARQALKLSLPPGALTDRPGREQVARIICPALAAFGLPTPRSLGRVGHLIA